MGSLFQRMYNLARAEITHHTQKDKEFSQEFTEFFKQQPEYEAYQQYYQQHSSGSSSHHQSSSDSSHHKQDYRDNQGYDPYEVLEALPTGAPWEDVEKAFRKMARKYHPDRFQDTKEKEDANKLMSIINASYSFLKQKHGKK